MLDGAVHDKRAWVRVLLEGFVLPFNPCFPAQTVKPEAACRALDTRRELGGIFALRNSHRSLVTAPSSAAQRRLSKRNSNDYQGDYSHERYLTHDRKQLRPNGVPDVEPTVSISTQGARH